MFSNAQIPLAGSSRDPYDDDIIANEFHELDAEDDPLMMSSMELAEKRHINRFSFECAPEGGDGQRYGLSVVGLSAYTLQTHVLSSYSTCKSIGTLTRAFVA